MPTISPDDLCKRHGYPSRIADQLKKICEVLQAAHVSSVYFVGSGSRGELTYRQRSDNELALFSDYEFIVVPSAITTAVEKSRALSCLSTLERQFASDNALFHIDTVWIGFDKLRHLPRTFQIFEAKSSGVTLLGCDLSSKLPSINLQTLDFCELNEVLIWRLWALLLYLPMSFLRDGSSDESYSYVLCRNALDLTTWALPHDGVLLTSFRQRVAHIQSQFNRLPVNRALGDAWPRCLDAYMGGKFHLTFAQSTRDLYMQVTEQFSRAVQYLGVLRSTVPERARFNNWQLRRKAYEVLRMWRGRGGLDAGLRWLWRPKYDLELECLTTLHAAMRQYLRGEMSVAGEYQGAAADLLRQLLPWEAHVGLSGDFAADWLAQRWQYAEFLMQFSYSVGAKRPYLMRLLQGGDA